MDEDSASEVQETERSFSSASSSATEDDGGRRKRVLPGTPEVTWELHPEQCVCAKCGKEKASSALNTVSNLGGHAAFSAYP
jgi:rubredoxin